MNEDRWYYAGECFVILACCVALDSALSLRCLHPVVNAQDSWALAGGESKHSGSDCRSERERRWFAPCGMRGKLWDAK